MTTEREKILSALSAWIRQRPGLEFANYGDVSAYRSEMRAITKDRHIAETLLSAVRWREGITADDLKEAFRAFSGRLTWDGERLDYCAGQYWPTEYRKAACAVLASALWHYTREKVMPASSGKMTRTHGPFTTEHDCIEGVTPGDWLRRYFRREFGRTIASRYFN